MRARLPLIAQIAGAAALVAAIAMPRLAEVPQPTAVVQAAPAVPPAPVVAEAPLRSAHLNLDVRHAFGSVDLSVTVDGKRVFNTKLEGSGKRFKVFGKRAERGFTKSLDLSPGIRVVRVRVRSAPDKFDHTRTERFDLGSASVAAMRIEADQSGLSVLAERPPVPPSAPVAPAPQVVPQIAQAAHIAQAGQVAQAVHEASALAELYQALRNLLIAVAGVVASAATGVVVKEFLKSRKILMRL